MCRLLLTAIALLALSSSARSQSEADGFVSMRRPVLGLAVQQNAAKDLFRLISLGPPEVALQMGSLAECEEMLIEVLRSRHGEGRTNLILPTLGGLQFWSDMYWYADWRIQENVYSGHFRLLNPQNKRVAWGSEEACRTQLESERIRRKLQLPSKHLVVLLHGLGRSRNAMKAMQASLKNAGFAVASVGYPSTRQSIAEHADGLNKLLEDLDGVDQVSFVTHSLGGIVVRATLADKERVWSKRIKLGRVVMLAPPNRGSELAQDLSSFSPFRILAGPSAEELRHELSNIPAPPCPFGIVAASRGDDTGWSPFLTGDNDGVVSVEETKLEGAADHLIVKGIHTLVMNDPFVIAATLRFLREGRFREEESRQDYSPLR